MNSRNLLYVPDIDHWTIEQMIAVHDLCQSITTQLMDKHGDALIEKMLEMDRQNGSLRNDKQHESQYPLPFDDPL